MSEERQMSLGRDEEEIPEKAFNFRRIVLSLFGLGVPETIQGALDYLKAQSDLLLKDETWDIEMESHPMIFQSSAQFFSMIEKILTKCNTFKGEQMLTILKALQRRLEAYASKILSRSRKDGTRRVAAATGTDGQIQASDEDKYLFCCCLANSAEYCHRMSGELAANVSEMFGSRFANKIDMSEAQRKFSDAITNALKTVAIDIEAKFDAEMVGMTRVPWATLESVDDQSEYVNNIRTILTASLPLLEMHLSTENFRSFLDKLALGLRFYRNIFNCKQMSETGAKQMLLDTQAVKNILPELLSLGNQTSAVYSKFTTEMNKAEAVLKVILSPDNTMADTYCALLPDSSVKEFGDILDLKLSIRTHRQRTRLNWEVAKATGFNLPGSGELSLTCLLAGMSTFGTTFFLTQTSMFVFFSSSTVYCHIKPGGVIPAFAVISGLLCLCWTVLFGYKLMSRFIQRPVWKSWLGVLYIGLHLASASLLVLNAVVAHNRCVLASAPT